MESLLAVAAEEEAAGRLADAERDFRTVVDARRRVLGSQHPRTAEALNYLGGTCYLQHRYDEARRCFLEVLEIRNQSLGPDHSDTLAAMGNVVEADLELGNLEEAETTAHRILDLKTRKLGPGDPALASALEVLADVAQRQHRGAQEKEFLVRALRVNRLSAEPASADTLRILQRLATLEAGAGHRDQALDYLRQAVEGGFRDWKAIEGDARWAALRRDLELQGLERRADQAAAAAEKRGP
jgi:tetratricopeptide (TPR) repeat protein